MLMAFTQEDIKQEAKQEFTVKLWGYQEINCDEITDSSEIEFIKDNWGNDIVMKSIQADNGDFYLISPMMSSEYSVGVYDEQAQEITDKIRPEQTGDEMGITIPNDWDGMHMYVVFKDYENSPKKVLMITPKQ